MLVSGLRKSEKIIKFLEKKYGPIRHYYEGDPFKVLISCIISQRTREENTEKVSKALFKVADTPEKLSNMPLKILESLIRPSGTFRQKAKHIKETSKIILKKYNGMVPLSRKELIKLPGVGFKTADVVIAYGHKKPSIAVDTHVNQISKRLGLVDREDSVENVREKLEDFFPKEKWRVINIGFVRFGRDICLPRNPKCNICELRGICKYFKEKYQKKGPK